MTARCCETRSGLLQRRRSRLTGNPRRTCSFSNSALVLQQVVLVTVNSCRSVLATPTLQNFHSKIAFLCYIKRSITRRLRTQPTNLEQTLRRSMGFLSGISTSGLTHDKVQTPNCRKLTVMFYVAQIDISFRFVSSFLQCCLCK